MEGVKINDELYFIFLVFVFVFVNCKAFYFLVMNLDLCCGDEWWCCGVMSMSNFIFFTFFFEFFHSCVCERFLLKMG